MPQDRHDQDKHRRRRRRTPRNGQPEKRDEHPRSLPPQQDNLSKSRYHSPVRGERHRNYADREERWPGVPINHERRRCQSNPPSSGPLDEERARSHVQRRTYDNPPLWYIEAKLRDSVQYKGHENPPKWYIEAKFRDSLQRPYDRRSSDRPRRADSNKDRERVIPTQRESSRRESQPSTQASAQESVRQGSTYRATVDYLYTDEQVPPETSRYDQNRAYDREYRVAPLTPSRPGPLGSDNRETVKRTEPYNRESMEIPYRLVTRSTDKKHLEPTENLLPNDRSNQRRSNLASVHRSKHHGSDRRNRPQPSQRWEEHQREDMSKDALKVALKVNPNILNRIWADAFLLGIEMPKATHARAQLVFGGPEFGRWLCVPYSETIVIDNAPGTIKIKHPYSDLTHYSAGLSKWFSGRENTYTLSFFCGYHSEYLIADTSPLNIMVGLLCSFCHQLLTNEAMPDIDCVLTAQQKQSLEDGIEETLLRVFTLLVKTFMKDGRRLLCFIDGTHVLVSEDLQHFRELLSAFEVLANEANDSGSKFVVKLVIMHAAPWDCSILPDYARTSLSNAEVDHCNVQLNKDGIASPLELKKLLLSSMKQR